MQLQAFLYMTDTPFFNWILVTIFSQVKTFATAANELESSGTNTFFLRDLS